jgi:hypothetical protein
LLSPVNPKTDAKKCDPITIGAMLWLVDDENRAGLLLIKPRCFVEEECADEVINGSTEAAPMRFYDWMTCQITEGYCALQRE